MMLYDITQILLLFFSSGLGMSGADPLDMPRTPYRASEGKRSQ